MENINKDELLDLGSDPVGEDFDPFAEDDNDAATEQPETAVPAKTATVPEVKESEPAGFADKPPVFKYARATENIDDASKTFDELRIEKSADFPELEDGKRVSWTVEYGKITKTVTDPKGMSVGKMKSDIETSKALGDSLKKRGADKNPTCKIKPRVTAQSKANDDYAGGRYIQYMDVHSHNCMKAFFSSVDDNDEKATRLYTVIGRLDKYLPDVKTRISNGGKFMDIDPAEVFEFISGPIPDEWKNRVHFKTWDDGHEIPD